jgi:hypothetical protein
MFDLLASVRIANMRGKLYSGLPCERTYLDAMVRKGWVIPVAATTTSLRGYVAVPVESFAALIDATQVD